MKNIKSQVISKRRYRLRIIILLLILILVFWIERNYSKEIGDFIYKVYMFRYGGDVEIVSSELPKIIKTNNSKIVDEIINVRPESVIVLPNPNNLGKTNLFIP